MVCKFCKGLNHSSENCLKFSTLRDRLSALEYPEKRCLCKNVYNCCKKVCEICLQRHHIALCPKRDPIHQNGSKNQTDSFNFSKLDYFVIKRFLALCNPIDKMKLRTCCKYLRSSTPADQKLYFSYYSNEDYPDLIEQIQNMKTMKIV